VLWCRQWWQDHPYSAALAAIVASGLVFAPLFVMLANRFMPQLMRPFLEKAGPMGRRLMRKVDKAGG
jgi:hypothetical protein